MSDRKWNSGWKGCLYPRAVLDTQRLSLRPLSQADAEAIQENASLRETADTMISIPHPYPADEASRYITGQMEALEQGHGCSYVIEEKAGSLFCGITEIRDIDREHFQAELSFWLVPAVRGHGYMQEALEAVVEFAFTSLGMNRLYAHHMVRNPASGRVLLKTGFIQEGILRQRVCKWDVFEDVALLALLREDWQKGNEETR